MEEESVASPEPECPEGVPSDENMSVGSRSRPESICSPDSPDFGDEPMDDGIASPESEVSFENNDEPAQVEAPSEPLSEEDVSEITETKFEEHKSDVPSKPIESQTVETLEGELDFEEEINEKEEREAQPSLTFTKEVDEPTEESNLIKTEKADKVLITIQDDKLEEGETKPEEELPKKADHEEGEADDGEVSDEDELEEGEVKDGAVVRKGYPKPVCRFFNKGQCTWGSSCRFIHPGVNDKGNYNMFSPTKPPMANPMISMIPPPPMINMPPMPPMGRMRPMIGPDYRPLPPVEEPPTESAWERGLRHAKEIIKKASRLKEQEPDFEEKRMNLSMEKADRAYEYDREVDKYRHSPSYRRPVEPPYGYYKDDGREAFEEREHQEHWRGGRYENFEVRWNRQDYDYRDFKDKPRRFSRSMEREKYDRRTPDVPERWQEERYGEVQPPRGRGDEWRDPWRRSKTPKGRRSRSQNRTGRRSYSSGSSRSFSSRSSRSTSYSYSRSSSSKSSRFSSERTPPRVSSRGSYSYPKSPPARTNQSFEKDMYEPRRRAPPRPTHPAPGAAPPSRNQSPPSRPPARKGPSPTRKIINISPSNFSPPPPIHGRMTPPTRIKNSPSNRKPPSPLDMSPPPRKFSPHRRVKGPIAPSAQSVSPPPMPQRRKPGGTHYRESPGVPKAPSSPLPTSPPVGRVSAAGPKDDKKRTSTLSAEKSNQKTKPGIRTRPHTNVRGSFSGSESSRSLTRSRSRSISLGRSLSMSSVSSASSSISHSSSNSEPEKRKGTAKGVAKAKPASPPARKAVEKATPRPPVMDAGRGRPQEPKIGGLNLRERPRAQERKFEDYGSPPSKYSNTGDGSRSASNTGGTDLTIPLLVSKQSKDLLKQSGQKQQIKLTLLTKAQKQPSSIEKTQSKQDQNRLKHLDPKVEEPSRGMRKTPPPPQPSRKRHASPPSKPTQSTLAKNLLDQAKKSTTSRREELLKQLKAVEDAIARKRSKLS